jgi:hypothetical protein
MSILDRRILGPINQFPVTSSGGSSLTIVNNVEGYILKATGVANKVEGIPKLKWDNTNSALSASGDVYVTGSSNYLYLHGTNAAGETTRFKFAVSGSLLQVIGEGE